jgi:DNA-binding protein H-NS
MSSYRDYLAQIEELKQKAEEARKKELAEVINDIKAKIAEHGLTAADLGLAGGGGRRSSAPAPRSGGKVPPKYKGPNGELWTGRGRKPAWVVAQLNSGRSLAEFEIR